MSKIKYTYSDETCQYEPLRKNNWTVALNFMSFLTVSLIIAVGLLLASSHYTESAKEASLRKENQELKLHFDILNHEMASVQHMLHSLKEKDDNVYRLIFEANPIPSDIRTAGTGGSNKYKDLLDKSLIQEDLIVSNFKRLDKLKRQIYIQTKSYDEIIDLAINKAKMLAAIPAIQPIQNKELKRLASGYGQRIHPIYKIKKMHKGLDFSAPRGTPIYATGAGRVKLAKKSYRKVGYGNQVEVSHGFGYVTKYAHMQRIIVKKGQKVKRGDLLGYVGNTGGSTSPHCHYEIIKDGKKINPIQYIIQDVTDKEYQKLLDLASIENQSLG